MSSILIRGQNCNLKIPQQRQWTYSHLAIGLNNQCLLRFSSLYSFTFKELQTLRMKLTQPLMNIIHNIALSKYIHPISSVLSVQSQLRCGRSASILLLLLLLEQLILIMVCCFPRQWRPLSDGQMLALRVQAPLKPGVRAFSFSSSSSLTYYCSSRASALSCMLQQQ